MPQTPKAIYAKRWQRARRLFLDAHPFCAYCLRAGRHVAAEVVDHIVPHRGDAGLFWDTANWQPLCARCHNSTKKTREQRSGVDRDGWPVGQGRFGFSPPGGVDGPGEPSFPKR